LIIGNTYKGAYRSIIRKMETGEEQKVYNLETECGNYIADGFIVHNCYVKFPPPVFGLVAKELGTNLGEGNFIFVGSSTDEWCTKSLAAWLKSVLSHCCQFPNNRYLFQSKNPAKFLEFVGQFPPNTILGTTIETNQNTSGFSKAPYPRERYNAMLELGYKTEIPLMLSVEPIMDFELADLVGWVKQIKPEFVSIGADSKGHNLPEPSPEDTRRLIEELRDITKVYVKDNLNRLLG
jgi:DNA repair photolyase